MILNARITQRRDGRLDVALALGDDATDVGTLTVTQDQWTALRLTLLFGDAGTARGGASLLETYEDEDALFGDEVTALLASLGQDYYTDPAARLAAVAAATQGDTWQYVQPVTDDAALAGGAR